MSLKRTEKENTKVGILLLDENVIRVPGDVGHKKTYNFPVTFRVVHGVRVSDLISRPSVNVERRFLSEASALVNEGIEVLATSCGFAILLQDVLSRSLPVPVLTSSLLVIPFLKNIYRRQASIGVITSDSRLLRPKHLEAVGVDPGDVVVKGLQEVKSFYEGVLHGGPFQKREVESDVVKACLDTMKMHNGICAFVFECANLHPYIKAVKAKTSLPVFDIVSLINIYALESKKL